MNIASIDTGTNTILLLIATPVGSNLIQKLTEIHNMPRLGEDVAKSGIIKEEKIKELCRIYNEYKEVCNEYKVTKIIACGTNVFRIAKNTPEVIHIVKSETGIDLKIISGEEEAESSFLGATADFDKNQNIAVIDIGGGSTEITCKNNNNLLFRKSFTTGVVTLREKFVNKDSLSKSNLDELSDFCNNYFSELENVRGMSDFSISIAGTPTTLFSLYNGYTEFKGELIHKHQLSIKNIDEVVSGFIDLPFKEYEKYGKIITGREDLMGAGAIILKTVLNKLGLDGTTISITGLRYGIILTYLAQNPESSQT
jgi:exopolyphosphatase/guanosine-5'-triphosphate,3'-diphosphate pyrophosphatase